MPIGNDIFDLPFSRKYIRIKAFQLCRRRKFSLTDFNDMQEIMRAYLWEKSHLFDPSRGSLEAFITTALNSCVAMIIRYRERAMRSGDFMAMSLERTYVEHDGGADMLRSVIAEHEHHRRVANSTRSAIEQLELREAIDHAIESLTPDEQDLLLHVAEHGVLGTAREWSRRENRNVTRHQIDKRVRQMRRRFEDAGLGAD